MSKQNFHLLTFVAVDSIGYVSRHHFRFKLLLSLPVRNMSALYLYPMLGWTGWLENCLQFDQPFAMPLTSQLRSARPGVCIGFPNTLHVLGGYP